MENYLHRVVGLYTSPFAAALARDRIVAHGIAPAQVRLLTAGPAGAGADSASDSDDVLKDLLRDGAIGTAVGTAAGGQVGRSCWSCVRAPRMKRLSLSRS